MRTSETTRTKRFGAILLVCGAVAAAWLAVAGTDQGSAARAVAPSNLDPPTISGTTRVGSTLTASTGRWNGTQPIAYAYSWRRCDQDGGSCSAISGANEKTYLLKPVDAGNTLRVRVVARNGDGAANATSVPTGLVTTEPTPPADGVPERHRHDPDRAAVAAGAAPDRSAGHHAAGRDGQHRPDHGPLPRDGVRWPHRAGGADLRDRRAVQPVLGTARAGHGRRRLGPADHGTTARLPGVTAPAAPRDVRTGAEER